MRRCQRRNGAGRGLAVDIAKAALTARHSVIATGRDAAVTCPTTTREVLPAMRTVAG